MHEMLNFLSSAPYFMITAFFATFAVTRLAQSETLYRVISDAFSEDRHTKVKKTLREMDEVTKCLMGEAKEQDLSPQQRRLLNQIRQGYYQELGGLFKRGDKHGRTK
jgi:hypothetical protein